MTVASIGILVFLFIFVAILMAEILIGVFVYKDAKRRNMNAILWILIALLAPGFVGIIIYLVVRTGYSDSQCLQCGSNVKEDYMVCPNCGASLKEYCGNCNYPLEAGWSKCPSCGTEIPEEQKAKIVPKKNKDGMLKFLLIFVVIGVVGVVGGIAMMFVGFGAIKYSGSDEENYYESYETSIITSGVYQADSVTNGYINREEIEKWMDECDKKGDGVYALKVVGDEHAYIEYLVYNNDGYTCVEISGDETYADFHFAKSGNTEYEMNYAFFKGSSQLELKIYKDGRPVECTIEEVDTLKVNIESLE